MLSVQESIGVNLSTHAPTLEFHEIQATVLRQRPAPYFGTQLAFGEKVFDTIEAEPERLREAPGIGPVRAKRITDALAEQKVVREIMVFLHEHGTAAFAP